MYNDLTLQDAVNLKGNKMTKTLIKMTKQDRLLEALQAGEQFTSEQITSKFGIANPTATVSDLRLRVGFAVYANKRTDKNGKATTMYRLGRPSRAVVAAGYRALASK